MAKVIQKISAEYILRLFLALMYLYSGFDLFRHPRSWLWAIYSLSSFAQTPIRVFGDFLMLLVGLIFVPLNITGVEAYLKFQGLGEILFALIFLAWFLPKRLVKFVAALTALEMAAILLLGRLDQQTFRDIGLLGAALTLFLLLYKDTSSSTEPTVTAP